MAVFDFNFSERIPNGAGRPEAEQDEDGTVTVRWITPDFQRMFSLTILPEGKGIATNVLPPLTEGKGR